VPLPVLGEEGAVAFQIIFVNISLPMSRAVVLVDPPSPIDPQVGTSDEPALLVEDVVLRVTGISAAWCGTRMIDSQADSLRASSRGMTCRSRGAPRLR
jgi:hypothetical protein